MALDVFVVLGVDEFAAADGGDAGPGDVGEAEGLHEVDEGIDFCRFAGDFEDEGLQR